MTSTDLPEAVARAQLMLWNSVGKAVPAHRVRFELATEPDQYRVIWLSPDDEFAYRALVLHITLTPKQFATWQIWLDAPEGVKP